LSVQASRSFFASTVSEFLGTEPEQIIGRMSARLATLHRSAERTQIEAWARQIELLTSAFREVGQQANDWSILFETPLLRLGRRLDVVVLAPGVVMVIEFKVNAANYRSADLAQTEFYALSLRDFHAASQERIIIPILCADLAKETVPSRTAAATNWAWRLSRIRSPRNSGRCSPPTASWLVCRVPGEWGSRPS
jgi:hypothetical protein